MHSKYSGTAKCPFFIADRKKDITCEGPERESAPPPLPYPHTVLHLVFPTIAEKDRYCECFCSENYRECTLAAAHFAKYGKGRPGPAELHARTARRLPPKES